jgi:hypothetical protein
MKCHGDVNKIEKPALGRVLLPWFKVSAQKG